MLRTAPVHLNATAVANTAKFVMMYVGKPHHLLIEELIDLHAALVDPQELSVPSSVFEACAKESGLKNAPHLARAVIMRCGTLETYFRNSASPARRTS